MSTRHRLATMLLVAAAVLAVGISAGAARSKLHHARAVHHHGGGLTWTDCGGGYQCANLQVPRDYRHPHGATFNLGIIRLPAQGERLGAMFVNFGGPGGDAVDTIHAIGAGLFGAVNDHFDIVAVDPRGVTETQPSVDCHANQETQGIYSEPFVTPFNLDRDALIAKDRQYIQQCIDQNGTDVLRYLSTKNTARDMDRVRAAMGDQRLNYFGFSYGTFLGSTYASLFPNRYRAMVLDGPVDVNGWINRPMENLREQSNGFEQALARFFQACASHQDVCQFGGEDPADAYEQLVQAAYQNPLPATGGDPRPVGGDDLIAGAMLAMYAKQLWPFLVQALQEAHNGDGTTFRLLADFFYGRNDDGSYSPGGDRYFLITAADQAYQHVHGNGGDHGSNSDIINMYLDAGNHSWGLFPHAWWNAGYAELNYGLYNPRPNDVYRGPFRASNSSPTVLEVATTYDPATPYHGALRTAAQLGNDRLLTMRGDGHTAYGGNSQCIDDYVNAYIETLALPPVGTVCDQQVPFGSAGQARTTSLSRILWRTLPHGGSIH
jgi:pimeloyl-ACP methyl ester carboxylesterase